MRVIIAGGRDFSDYQLLKDRVNYYMRNASDVVVICGEAKGADLLGKNLAKENGWSVKVFLLNGNCMVNLQDISVIRRWRIMLMFLLLFGMVKAEELQT